MFILVLFTFRQYNPQIMQDFGFRKPNLTGAKLMKGEKICRHKLTTIIPFKVVRTNYYIIKGALTAKLLLSALRQDIQEMLIHQFQYLRPRTGMSVVKYPLRSA